MKYSDLQSLSLSELEALQSDVEKALDQKKQQAQVIDQIKAMALENGIPFESVLSELQGSVRKTTGVKSKSAPQYYNPADPSQTWTGKGRKPKWIEEALNNGSDLEDFRIAG
ncbi:histidinol phosphate phosphatase [Pokkaliibacter plantistimulans]|uniref:Histidinol phosphate phosphatase n=1 Tax=Proteobacteria bacterium 228 TaxID=2083153 RepID=A0A2S5KM94_9PROT|nr:H-NS histone family protein [Pokkaliibacter plantistimulans]PPC75765.1 histidinol phosphate phosphatase [Pokkaliibacter plantistimulans]